MRRDESFLSLPFNHLSCLMTPRERCVHPSQASSFLNMHSLNTESGLGRHQEDPKARQASKTTFQAGDLDSALVSAATSWVPSLSF